MRNRSKQDLLQDLKDLEASTSDALKAQRSSVRYTSTTRVWVQPGNSSARTDASQIEGTTADISEMGCKLLLASPLTPGDVYLVSFDREDVDIAPVFARCMRARLIDEGAFEAGMKFFAKIELNVLVPEAEDLPELV